MGTGEERRVAVVVEDEVDIRHLLEEVLQQAGFQVIATGNGPDGLAAVRLHNPIVVTLDVNMPGMDGFEVARRIREFSNTYIVMLTALQDEIDTLDGLRAGADDYLTKPFRPRELRARIEAMLRRPRDISTDGPSSGAQAAIDPTPTNPTYAAYPAPTPAAALPVAPVASPPQPVYSAPAVPVTPAAEIPVAMSAPVAAPAPAHPVEFVAAPPAPAPAAAPEVDAEIVEPDLHAAALSPQHVDSSRDTGDRHGENIVVNYVVPTGEGWIAHNGLSLNTQTGEVRVDGHDVVLLRSEFDLLASLLKSGRRVRTKPDLVLLLRRESFVTTHFVSDAEKRAIDVLLGSLRKKLGENLAEPRWVEAVGAVGYRATMDDSV